MMKNNVIALCAGLLMGLGLCISHMANPAKVLAFFDVTGAWDSSLALVMGGALSVTLISFRFILKRKQPQWSKEFHLPTKTRIDKPLIIGSAIFGIGWGLSGYCPAPALAGWGLGEPKAFLFSAAMLFGMYVQGVIKK